MTGVVIKVFLNKGFAFVRGEDKISRFAHARDFIPPIAFDTLYEGAPVDFTSATDENGKGNKLRALNVHVKGHA